MYTGLLHLHSLLRWIGLILLIVVVFKSLIAWQGKKGFTSADNKLSLFTMIAFHIQLVIGLGLYFISDIVEAALNNPGAAMKASVLRYWFLEHQVAMILAIVLITIGRSKLKRIADPVRKHKNLTILFGIALLILLVTIPWPFREVGAGRGWF